MWYFVRGYVILQIEGMGLERMVNALLDAGVRVRRICRTDAVTAVLTMPAADVRLLFALRRRYRFRLHIVKRVGLPFAARRLMRRKTLLLGTLLVLAGFVFLSTRVLFVEVRGCERMDQALLLRTLQAAGVERFMAWRGVDFVRIANDTAALFDQIAWLGLHREGVFLTVEVKEAIPLPEIEAYTTPCDVVATKAGVIVRITLLRGKALVRPGDRVTDGQTLIAGTVQYKETEPYLTRARGEVTAAVVYQTRVPAPETERILTETGRTRPLLRVRIGSRTLFAGKCPYPVFAEEITGVSEIGRLFSVMTVERGVWRELAETERRLTETERMETALVLAETGTLAQLPAEADVIVKAAWTEEQDGVLYGVCRITTEESIGIQREITDGANGRGSQD